MEEFLNDLVAHNIQNRTVAFIENGTWAPQSGKLMRGLLEKCKNITFIDNPLSLKSSLKDSQLAQIDKMTDAIAMTIEGFKPRSAGNSPSIEISKAGSGSNTDNLIDASAMFNFSYGLFVLTARDGDKDNGCIINTAIQVTLTPMRISIAVNKVNLTHDMILKTGRFALSILSESAPFDIYKCFGFRCGRDVDKFLDFDDESRTICGLRYLPQHANSVISGKVVCSYDYGTHTIFVADVVQAFILSDEPSVTYDYYFKHIKPKPPQMAKEDKKGYICKICAYIYEGDDLPSDFICPLCKHGAEDFEKL